MQAPPLEQTSVLQVKTGHQAWQKKLNRIFENINEPFRAFRKTETTTLTCAFYLNRELEGWQKMLDKICYDLSYSSDGPLVYLQGKVDPKIFIKRLYKARSYVVLYRFDYGFEKNREGTRKPKSHRHFMRCIFEQNALDVSWYKRIIGALKTFQDVSLTIDTPAQKGYEMEYHQKGYLCGNIKIGMFMKMLEKTGVKVLGFEYGFVYNNPHLKPPPPMKLGTETQPAEDTVSPFLVHQAITQQYTRSLTV